MPCSMTGFARQELQQPWGTLICEIRSVNHRYLEPSLRLPENLRSAEPILREQLRQKLSRGKVEVSLFLKTEQTADTQLGINTGLAERIIELSQEIKRKIAQPSEINPLDILRWPGVIKTAELDLDTINAAATSVFACTLDALISNREREGEELALLIGQRLQSIATHVTATRTRLPEILAQHQLKLRVKLEALKIELDEERYSQEAVYIAQKSDVSEELDRLEAHLTEVRHTLQQKGPIGRRLDFLMQELNREANTLSSKSMASDTTQSAVDIKVFIEQMREQIQNIE